MLIVGTETKMRRSAHKTRLQDVWFVYVPALIAERFPAGGQDMIAACTHPESPDFRIRVELRFIATHPCRFINNLDSIPNPPRLWIAEDSRRGTLRIPSLVPFEAAELPDTTEGLLSLHCDEDGRHYLVWEYSGHGAAEEVNG